MGEAVVIFLTEASSIRGGGGRPDEKSWLGGDIGCDNDSGDGRCDKDDGNYEKIMQSLNFPFTMDHKGHIRDPNQTTQK
ncbi:unnamed protein product [Lupinus luteus]|uniref:Uncharacterized protein n=1 Tax=Lupinus luteus TaxID=3873 RepID=A0AAV1XPF9_LUPLU